MIQLTPLVRISKYLAYLLKLKDYRDFDSYEKSD